MRRERTQIVPHPSTIKMKSASLRLMYLKRTSIVSYPDLVLLFGVIGSF